MACFALDWTSKPPEAVRSGFIAIGNFDGVHRGHGALVAELRDQARAQNLPAVVVTFDPHPLQLLKPSAFQPVLTTLPIRVDLIHGCGADHVFILRTDPSLLELTAEQFFSELVLRRFAAHGLVEGENFGFGKNRQGDVSTLRTLCDKSGLCLTIVPPVRTSDGLPVSSSRVRFALVNGNVRLAADYLNRPYQIRGWVATGQRRGQTLGFPTANLERVATLVPGDGVYAVRVAHKRHIWSGAANVGPNPTFGEQERKVEVHLIDFHGDLYGQLIDVDFVERIRDTKPFANADQLIEQLQKDIQAARSLLATPPP